MMYALCNYRITNINVGSNLLGDETSLSARKLVGEGYMCVQPRVELLGSLVQLFTTEKLVLFLSLKKCCICHVYSTVNIKAAMSSVTYVHIIM